MNSHQPGGAVAGALLALTLLSGQAHATDVSLDFASLPSAQGWTYSTSGVPAAESPTWSAAGGVLSVDTMPYELGAAGGTTSFYARGGSVSPSEPLVIEFRARVLESEHDGGAFIGGGFAVGFGDGVSLWQLGILPGAIRNVVGTVLTTAYDNTQFHDYRMEWTPPSTLEYFVDGALISSDPTGLALGLNRIHIGDVTGAANARAEVTYYRFRQGAATGAGEAVAVARWGRVKALYR